MTTADLITDLSTRLNASLSAADLFVGYDNEAAAYHDGRVAAFIEVLAILRSDNG